MVVPHLLAGFSIPREWDMDMGLTTAGLLIDTVGVEGKGLVRGINVDSHGAVLDQRSLQSHGTARLHGGVTSELGHQLRLVAVAVAVLWGGG